MKKFLLSFLLSLAVMLGLSAQTISVNNPAPSTIWRICTQQNITWTFSGTSPLRQFNIDYSNDGGANWSSIASFLQAQNASSGSFSWTVPNTPSPNCLVRVIDANNVSTLGISGAFTIQTPLVLTSPIGGDRCNGQRSPERTNN